MKLYERYKREKLEMPPLQRVLLVSRYVRTVNVSTHQQEYRSICGGLFERINRPGVPINFTRWNWYFRHGSDAFNLPTFAYTLFYPISHYLVFFSFFNNDTKRRRKILISLLLDSKVDKFIKKERKIKIER